MIFRLPQCPYCGKRVNFFRAWYLKREGEFMCGCGNYSNVFLHPVTPYLGALTVVISLILFLVVRLLEHQVGLHCVLWVTAPFFLFFLASPFLIQLKKPIFIRKKQALPPEPGKK